MYGYSWATRVQTQMTSTKSWCESSSVLMTKSHWLAVCGGKRKPKSCSTRKQTFQLILCRNHRSSKHQSFIFDNLLILAIQYATVLCLKNHHVYDILSNNSSRQQETKALFIPEEKLNYFTFETHSFQLKTTKNQLFIRSLGIQWQWQKLLLRIL